MERLILKIPISDFHQVFKIYSKKLYKTLDINKFANCYLFSFEIIIYAKVFSLTIKEIPVLCDYKSPHTSHKLFGKNSAFTYQLKTFKVLFLYLTNKIK